MKINLDLLRFNDLMNDIYKPAFAFSGRFLVLFGGSGSGKSVAIAQKIIFRMITEDDHNFLVVRKTANTLHRSCFALLVSLIKQYGLEPVFRINEAEGKEKIIYVGNGNQIQFAGMDEQHCPFKTPLYRWNSY